MKFNFKTGLLTTLALFFVFSTALAAEIIKPDPNNPNVTVGASETRRNLYTAGGNVTINGTTVGDLVAAGGMVTVEGDVEQDVMMAGGTLSLSGSIGDDARIAGGNITVRSPIGGDLVVAGGNINITSQAIISGDLIIAGGNVVVDAPVNGMVRVVGGNVTINSKINGDVFAQTSEKLIFGASAEVLGRVNHKGSSEAVVQQGAKIPAIEFTQWQGKDRGFGRKLAGLLTLAFLIKLLAWILVGLLLVRFGKGIVHQVVEEVRSAPWANAGWGLVGLIGVPIIIVVLFFTLIGYYVAIILGLSYALMLVVANVLASVVLGYIILRALSKPAENISDWQAVVIGVVVWSLIRLIPILGWLVVFVMLLLTLGAMFKMVKTKLIS